MSEFTSLAQNHSIGPNPFLYFVPSLHAFGSPLWVVKYQLIDAGGLFSNIATLIFNVAPLNDAPTSLSFSVNCSQNHFVMIPLQGHDVDIGDTETLVYSIIDLPRRGSIWLQGKELVNITSSINISAPYLRDSVTYRPYPGPLEFGAAYDSFTYLCFDIHGEKSNLATIVINVDQIDFQPLLYSGFQEINQGDYAVFNFTSDPLLHRPIGYTIFPLTFGTGDLYFVGPTFDLNNFAASFAIFELDSTTRDTNLRAQYASYLIGPHNTTFPAESSGAIHLLYVPPVTV